MIVAVGGGLCGGAITSNAGALLLRETDRAIGLIDRVAGCFTDGRSQADVAHAVETLVGQHIVGIALGYEDVNDHVTLRFDPVLALFLDKLVPRALMWSSTLSPAAIRTVSTEPNDRLWLQADIQPPEIDFRLTPNNGHSEAHAGLPLVTRSGS